MPKSTPSGPAHRRVNTGPGNVRRIEDDLEVAHALASLQFRPPVAMPNFRTDS
jgi:hypothetical protein